MNAKGKYGSSIMIIKCILISTIKNVVTTVEYKNTIQNNIGTLLSITDQITRTLCNNIVSRQVKK